MSGLRGMTAIRVFLSTIFVTITGMTDASTQAHRGVSFSDDAIFFDCYDTEDLIG